MTPWYCTREQVYAALDSAPTARERGQVDRLIAAASRDIEGLTRREFWPRLATRYFDWPTADTGSSWRLWFEQPAQLISAGLLQSGGATIAPADYTCYPDDGPPYNRVELLRSGSANFGGGATAQRDVAVTGWWGYRDDQEDAGQLAAAVTSSATQVAVTDSALVGVGDLIVVGAERMQVTEKSLRDTGTTLAGPLTAQKDGTTVTVTDGTAVQPGETILVDAERIAVDDVAGSTLIVRRAVEGSTLAAHTAGAAVYAPRLLKVERAAVATTANSHAQGDAVRRWTPPGPINSLCVAEVLVKLGREQSGMARTVGAGDALRAAPGGDIRDVRAQVQQQFRRYRSGAI